MQVEVPAAGRTRARACSCRCYKRGGARASICSLLTHPHPDHYGGLPAVLAQFELSKLWDNGQAEAERELQPTSTKRRSCSQRRAQNMLRVRGPATLCGASVDHGGREKSRCSHPAPDTTRATTPNDNSIVLRIDYGHRSVLFTGDAEQHSEARLLAGHAATASRRAQGRPSRLAQLDQQRVPYGSEAGVGLDQCRRRQSLRPSACGSARAARESAAHAPPRPKPAAPWSIQTAVHSTCIPGRALTFGCSAAGIGG